MALSRGYKEVTNFDLPNLLNLHLDGRTPSDSISNDKKLCEKKHQSNTSQHHIGLATVDLNKLTYTNHWVEA